jgi:hypothetical protein
MKMKAGLLFSEDEIERMGDLAAQAKKGLNELRRRLHDQAAALKEAGAVLREAVLALSEIKQHELITGEGTESFEQLRGLIGSEQASKVANAFAGTTIYIPKSVISNTNHARIKQEYRDGATYRELSRRYGYTESYVRKIIHRKKRSLAP